ncbi:hypothetical protein DYH09_02150 [bacterium CPR1]|nr:hypothetical protein [bacterium CPR1]
MTDEVKKTENVNETRSGSPAAAAPEVAPPPQDDRGAAARATGTAPPPAGRELDAGKSTQKGDTDYFDGKSVITDADTAIEIGQMLANRGKSEMKVEDMLKELQNRGYAAELTNVDGKKAIRFQNGDVFIDTSGDGQLGSEDVNFNKALSAIEQKHGVNLSQLKSTLDILAAQHKAEKDAKKLGALGAGMYGLGGADQDYLAIRDALRATDKDMAAAGYEGTETAFDLWQKSALNPQLGKLNITPPNIPSVEELSLKMANCQCCNMFTAAYDLAGLLKGRPYAAV